MIPRFIHKLWADACGYFWIPCQRCGKGWGGHQWKDFSQEITDGITGTAAYCPSCAKTRDLWDFGWRERLPWRKW